MRTELTTPAKQSPVSLQEFKRRLLINDTQNDTAYEELLSTVTQMVEQETNNHFMERVFTTYYDRLPYYDMDYIYNTGSGGGYHVGPSLYYHGDRIELPKTPVKSVTRVEYRLEHQDSWQEFTGYQVRRADLKPAYLIADDSFPTDLRLTDAIRVTYTVGYGNNVNDVPQAIHSAIAEWTASIYQTNKYTMPDVTKRLLKPYTKVLLTSNTDNRMGIL